MFVVDCELLDYIEKTLNKNWNLLYPEVSIDEKIYSKL